MLTRILVFLLLLAPVMAGPVEPPKGIFSSHVGAQVERYIHEPFVEGALIRVRWAELQPSPGEFDFAAIERQLQPVRRAGKKWSLAVLSGPHTPPWLLGSSPERMEILFRGQRKSIVPFWSDHYHKHADGLAKALARRYGSDPKLVLVYVPQQTSNGIEGHFNGNSPAALRAQGMTEERWFEASRRAIESYVRAFPGKALAFELHELLGDTALPRRLIKLIETRHAEQVGIGVWWLSGKERYQNGLLGLLKRTRLPIYAQVIGNSGESHRFPNGDYTAVFRQASELGIEYIEVWNYELERPVAPEVLQSIKAFSAEH